MDGKDYLIVLGAPKCGTTSVAAWLGGLPDTVLTRRKETLFFTDYATRTWSGPGSDFTSRIPLDDAAFRKQFAEDLDASLRVEASTDNLSCAVACDRIANFAARSDVRSLSVVAIVRDPIERVVSEFEHTLKLGWQSGKLAESLQAEAERRAKGWHPLFQHIERSRYAAQLARYRDAFGDRLLVLDFHELNEPATLERLAVFVDRGVTEPEAQLERRNARKVFARPRTQKLLSNKKALTVARKLVPANLRPQVRSLVQGAPQSRYVPTAEETETVLEALRSDIQASVAAPDIPTGNWSCLSGLRALG